MNENDCFPPGACNTRDVDLFVIVFPVFWLPPFAYAFDDCVLFKNSKVVS